MKYTAIATALLAIPLWVPSLQAGYGDPVGNFPSQKERDLHLTTNLVRSAPLEFKNLYIGSYSILSPTYYPAVPPVYLDTDLNNAGRAHAEDMAANCGLSHNSCNGTAWSTRIQSYYDTSGWISENIATGYSAGFSTVIQFLRDDINGTPAADNSAGDGHRKNIMNSRYQDFGPGYAYNSNRQWYHFWVQDFGGGPHEYYAIASGSHLYLSTGNIDFMATYYDPQGDGPNSAEVIINGIPYTMSHHLGSTSNGSYQLSLPDNNDCRDYYFQFVDSNNSKWRYPETTELSNNPGENCYTPATLTDAIVALKVVSGNATDEAETLNTQDYSGDGKIGLEEAIHVLRQLSKKLTLD